MMSGRLLTRSNKRGAEAPLSAMLAACTASLPTLETRAIIPRKRGTQMKAPVIACLALLVLSSCASNQSSDQSNKEVRCQQLLSRANYAGLLEAERVQAQAEATQLGCY